MLPFYILYTFRMEENPIFFLNLVRRVLVVLLFFNLYLVYLLLENANSRVAR